MELTAIAGIGEKKKELFKKLQIETAEDLVRYYPVSYDLYEAPVSIGELTIGEKASVRGMICARPGIFSAKGVKIVSVTISDPTGKLHISWFNMPYIRGKLSVGSVYVFHATVYEKRGAKMMLHPEMYTEEEYAAKIKTLSPVYGLTRGLNNKMISNAVREALKKVPPSNEYLPEQMISQMDLADEQLSVLHVHFPKDKEELFAARKRLAFDEFFYFIMAMRKLKDAEIHVENEFPMTRQWATEQVIDHLPYRLTKAQENVWHEIEKDLSGKNLMQRLIQGDVGSGKTILAFLAMVMTAANGYQSALMAPTEVLARQHFEKLTALINDGIIDKDIKPVLLTGAMKAKERREAYEEIASGEAYAVIGTHALIEDTVSFKDLALVITDEQHRFGVRQRKSLEEKGAQPNAMVMSATPIPRTLGVILYGDLDISVLDEMPARRLPVKSCVVDETYRPVALKFIKKQAEEGHQVYVICPLIEASDEMPVHDVITTAAKLKKELPDFKVGLLHGRMKTAEKDKVMASYVSGDINILVSTTVVEVGVDVPNATVMMIENAERFGLATLHQLRGRVGRGCDQSYCIFMTGIQNEEVSERLNILKQTNDGFKIASEDFRLRGPGDLLGIRQSGELLFHIADLTRDEDVLKKAGDAAASVMADDPGLLDPGHELLKKSLDEYIRCHEGSVVL